MPIRNDIIDILQKDPSQLDTLRKQFIADLSDYTGRNVITYYSGWMTKAAENLDINDSDMTGFMSSAHGLDRTKGLDLILHTPGGSPTASESIVKYLRKLFHNDIRVIVPHMAMSAGTMIACSAKEVIMGYQSSLGPIDPQFSGIPAYNIKAEFEEAEKDLQMNPENAQYWAIKLQQFPAAFLKSAIDAIELSQVLVTEWLGTAMYDKSVAGDQQIIEQIVSSLNEHTNSLVHDRHFDSDKCREIGIKVIQLENDQELQDKVLTLHHISMLTLDATPTVKMIENQNNSYLIQQMQ